MERNGKQTTANQAIEEEKKKARGEKLEVADEFQVQLVLLMELRRTSTHTQDQAFSTRYRDQLRKVSDMVTQSDLNTNPGIKIPASAMTAFQKLPPALDRLEALRKEYDGSVKEWEAALESRTKAALSGQRRGRAQRQEVANVVNLVTHEQTALEQAEENCSSLKERLCSMQESFEQEFNFAVDVAEYYFQKNDIIPPSSKPRKQQDDQGRKPAPKNDRPHVGRPQEDKTQHTRHHREQVHGPRPMIDIIREEMKESFDKAEKAVNEADHKREMAREHYDRDLREYLDAIKARKVVGTQSDFDRDFLLKQLAFTRQQRYAEDNLEHVRKDAEIVGAIDKDSGFSESPDDGSSDISDGRQDVLWQNKKKEIQEWVDMEVERVFSNGRDAAVGEDTWSVTDHREEEGSNFVEPFGDGIQPYLDDIIEEPEWRKMIDEWNRQQAKLRASIVLREPHW